MHGNKWMLAKPRRQLLLSSLFSLLVLLFGFLFFPEDELDVASVSEPIIASDSSMVPVVRIVDGDTIRVLQDGEEQVVRLVNINAPESVDPRRAVECMGVAASQYLTELLADQTVKLLVDDTQASQDRYGRLLRFVQLADERDVGELMIAAGFAYSTPYGRGQHVYFERYQAAQVQAQQDQRGLWAEDACPR